MPAGESWNPVQLMGLRAARAREISSLDDSGIERLAVDAKLSTGFVSEINLDETNDEVAAFGGVNGSETANAATRQIINVDSSGRVRIDLALLNGVAPSLDGGRLQVNATLQVADADVSAGNPVPVSDAGASLTVDNPTLSVVGGGVEATALRVTIASDSTGVLSVDDNGGSLTVDGTITANQGGAPWSVQGPSAGGTAAVGNPVLMGVIDAGSLARFAFGLDDNTDAVASLATANKVSVLARGSVFNGTTWDRLRGNTNGAFQQGNVGHDAVDAGNPIKLGGRALGHGTNPTAVAAADRTDWLFNRAGVPWVIGGHPNIVSREFRTTAVQTDIDILGAVGAETKVVVTQIQVAIDSDTSTVPKVRIGFGATTIPAEPASGAGVSGMVFSHPAMLAGSSMMRGDGSGILAVGGDGEELRMTNEVPTGGDIRVTISFYTIES